MDAATLETAASKDSKSTLSRSYVREAKIYDDGMVVRWKVLMDGLLLFAALFSAVVTAFIIESYKNLSPDPAAITVLLLHQISQQLSVFADNTSEPNVSLPDFSSSRKLAVIINVFWFLSLALSLTCALTATLIEQWASDYIRAIERREAAEIRARIRAYLFEGVENSNVAAIVEGTPLLLHASLFSFFIGLVFFLQPINTVMTFLTASILAVFAAAYLSATIAPLIDTASPFRTPLTTLVLQFSFARNSIRKTLLCGLKVASFLRSRAAEGVKNYYSAVMKHSSVVAERGRAMLSRVAVWIQSSLNKATMSPSSEIEERSAPAIHAWLEPFQEIWSDDTLYSSDLDAIKETTALDYTVPEFYEREIKSLSWTLQHTTNDVEMLLFLEGIPLYLKTTWSHLHFGEEDQTGRSSNIHSAHSVMQVVLHDQEGAFVSKLDTFVSTRLDSHRPIEEREASAVVNALWSLFDQNVLPYTDATSFLHPGKHVIGISPGWRLEIYLDRVGQQFPSLSVLQQHLELMATFRCAQRRDSKYPSKHWGQRWPFSHLGNLPRKLEDPELNPFCDEILSLLRDESVINESGRWGMHSRSADVIAAETNRGITLLGLCVYFWKDTALSSDDFTDHYFGRIMQQLPRFVSSLTVGSAGAQRAYSAAILLVTVVLERADLDLHHKDRYRSKLSPLLDPLVNISDDIAARNAQRIFCSPLWFRYLSRWKIPPRWLENPALNQILGSAELRRYLQIRWYLPDSILRSRMPEQVVAFAGMHSSMQNELLEPLKRWLTKGLPVISPDDVEAVFRLLVLLDDPKAVLHVQRALVQFLSTAAPSNVHERKMEAAREALGQLKVTASKPGFIFKALSLPDF